MAPAALLSTFLLTSLTQLLGTASASSHADKGAAQAGIQVPMVPQYIENITATALFHPKGWYAPSICEDRFCVYSNRGIANGRGITIISTSVNYQKIKRLDKIMYPMTSGFLPDPPVFEEQEIPGKGPGYVATSQIRRATKLMSLSPVILVHKGFFNETDDAGAGRLLEAAFHLLPDATRELFTSQMAKSKHGKSLKQVMLANPFETSTGSTGWDNADVGKHYAVYPETFPMGHDCRPNMAFYVELDHSMRLAAARKIQPGEELTISYINPRLPRRERSEVAQSVWGHGCTCRHCTGGGDLAAVAAHDSRHDEIAAVEEQLKDMDSRRVTTGMLARYLELIEQDGLQSKLAEAYELLAYNYNYLGYDKRALKYANLAIQAGVIEAGPDSNDVVAMRVFASGPRDHYSWQRKVKVQSVVQPQVRA